MSIKVVLFDLDGTLLPMNQDEFIKVYFKKLAKKLAPHGYEPEKLMRAVWTGTGAMIKNNGMKSNEATFWDAFAAIFGERVRDDLPLFDSFYRENFDEIKEVCGYTPKSAEMVAWIKRSGLRVVLATNPIFPSIATEKRIGWAGLAPNDFELFTTYENSKYCKPNLDYYREIIKQLDVSPEECLMVGNDVGDDMVVCDMGMKAFLLTDCLINKANADISQFPYGSFDELKNYIETINAVE